MFAQLIANGENHGIHGIMARIRDDNLKEIPGVTVVDMGHKMGLNGVDNAKISFDNVRVPRENLLNRSVVGDFIKFLVCSAQHSDLVESCCCCCFCCHGTRYSRLEA